VTEWRTEGFLSISAYVAVLIAILLVRKRYQRALTTQGMSPAAIQRVLPSQDRDFWTWGVVAIWTFVLCAEFAMSRWPVLLVVRHSIDRGFHLIIHLSLMYAAWFLWRGFRAGLQTALNRGESLRMRVADLAISKAGMIVYASVASLLGAAVFPTEGNDKLMLAGTILIAWIILTDGAPQSPIFSKFTFTPWRILGATLWLATIVLLGNSLFQAGLTPVLGSSDFRAVLIASMLFVIVTWRKDRAGRRLMELATVGTLLATTALGVFVMNIGRLRTVRSEQTRYVQLPGVPLRSDWSLPGGLPYNDWIDVGTWSRMHTPVNSTFFVPPDLAEFRVHAQRAIVGDWEDGGSAFYSWRFAQRWWRRMEDLKGYDAFDEMQFNDLNEKYHAQFAVTRASERLSFPVQYENHSFIVYALTDNGKTSHDF
jgi:hypothetical protein